jgi:hypothetical protein
VGVKIEKACFDWGIVPSLWFRQFTHDVKLLNLQKLSPLQQIASNTEPDACRRE